MASTAQSWGDAVEQRGFWVRLVVGVIKPTVTVLARRTWRGAEHIPASGGAIIAANHLSQLDPLVVSHFVYNNGRVPRFLTKAAVFSAPLVGRAMRETGQIPVQRGSLEAAQALDEAVRAVRAGRLVVVYPEGTTTRQPDHWPMRGRTGVARLAMLTGAPVIPIAQWGAQRLHDPLANKLRLRPRTPVTVVAGFGPRIQPRGAGRDHRHDHVPDPGHARRDPWRRGT
jgi:1-acyl-sn-glycerol-3-phosphate acyltransferase